MRKHNEKEEYKPYIKTSKFNSTGTTAVVVDWKTGRGIHCLSQGEVLWFYILRWDDDNIDIKEQVPLDMNICNEIFDKTGIPKVRNRKFVMSTDFLVTKNDGSRIAYSVKNDRDIDERTLQLLCVEKMYWMSQGIDFKILFKEDVNIILANNIRVLVEFYSPESVMDEISNAKHLLAIKKKKIDLTTRMIDIEYLYEQGLIQRKRV